LTESTIEGSRKWSPDQPLFRPPGHYAGRAWWLPLADDVRRAVDWFKFYQSSGARKTFVKYDTRDLFLFVLRGLPILGARLGQTEEQHHDGVQAGSLRRPGKPPACCEGFNWSKVSPRI